MFAPLPLPLPGNGQSDRPSLWFGRSRWWSVDDYVAKDLPAVLRHVLRETCCAQAHLVGHSMGGMVLTRLLALGGEAAAGVASATVVASGCFLKGKGRGGCGGGMAAGECGGAWVFHGVGGQSWGSVVCGVVPMHQSIV